MSLGAKSLVLCKFLILLHLGNFSDQNLMWIKLLNQSIHSGGKEEGRRNINVFRMEFFIVGLELK